MILRVEFQLLGIFVFFWNIFVCVCLFFQKLEEELSAHQETVKSVQKSGSNKRRSDSEATVTSPDEEEEEDSELAALRAKWEDLVCQEADRKRKLDANLEYIRPRVSYLLHLDVRIKFL